MRLPFSPSQNLRTCRVLCSIKSSPSEKSVGWEAEITLCSYTMVSPIPFLTLFLNHVIVILFYSFLSISILARSKGKIFTAHSCKSEGKYMSPQPFKQVEGLYPKPQ